MADNYDPREPKAPEERKASRKSSDSVGPGLVLIGIGVIWILMRLDILDFNIFSAVGDLWPLILIVVGVNLIFRNNRTIHIAAWVAFLAVVFIHGTVGLPFMERSVVRVDLDDFSSTVQEAIRDDDGTGDWTFIGYTEGVIDADTEQGTLDLNLGAGDLKISAGGSQFIAYTAPENLLRVTEYASDDMTRVKFDTKDHFWDGLDGDGMRFDYRLNPDVEWTIDLDIGAVSGEFDFSDLAVSKVDIDTGAGDMDIELGDKQEKALLDIDCAATDLKIIVPAGTGLMLDIDGVIKSHNLESLGFTSQDGKYYSPEYADAQRFVDGNIDLAVGEITVEFKE